MQARQHSSKRLSFLLILFVLGHEFNHVIRANAMLNFYTDKLPDIPKNLMPGAQQQAYNQVVLHRNSTDNETSSTVNVEKRAIPLLFGVAIATSLLSLGIDVLIKVKGCCVFYRSICRNVREFDYRKQVVSAYMKENDKQWLEVNAVKHWIDVSNTLNAMIWLEILSIQVVEDAIVETLGPDVINRFNTEKLKLKQAIEANNKTVQGLSYQELSDKLQSPFDNAEDTAMRLSGIVGMVAAPVAASAFKHYKIRQMSSVLKTSYGSKLANAAPKAQKVFGFTRASMTKHLHQTSKSAVNAKFAGAKYGKFMKGAGRLLSVVSIAWDIYSIIKKIKGCKKVRDRSSKSVREIREADKEARQLYYDLYRYKYQSLHEGFVFIKSQLISDDLKTVLESLIEMAKFAPPQAKDLRSVEPFLSKFVREIRSADAQKMLEFQKQLIPSLKKITIYYACYLTKIQLVKYVTNECKKGMASMQDLFNRGAQAFGSNNQYCMIKNGFPYTQFNDVQKIVVEDAGKEGFDVDCVINSQSKKNEVCGYKDDGYSSQQIVNKVTGLSLAQVEKIITTCPEKPLTPNEITLICKLRNEKKKSDEYIATFLDVKLDRVKEVKC